VTGLMLNGTDLVTSEAVHQAMHLHRKAMHLHSSGITPIHYFDLKALASGHCHLDEEFTWKCGGRNSHEVVGVVQLGNCNQIAVLRRVSRGRFIEASNPGVRILPGR
jgi:hypothetical protein